MNKSKVALGVICVVVTAALAYNQNQTQSPDQVQQGLSDEAITVANQSRSNNSIEGTKVRETSADNPLLSASQGVSNNGTVSNNTDGKASAKGLNKVNVLTQSHQKPADHASARQPKAHGHEHAQQRHPEDNSIIPPGEPKKPLPDHKLEQKDKK